MVYEMNFLLGWKGWCIAKEFSDRGTYTYI